MGMPFVQNAKPILAVKKLVKKKKMDIIYQTCKAESRSKALGLNL